MMISFLFGVLRQTWEILEEASVFLLFGFLLAGMLGILVPGRLLTRLVGGGKIKSVLWGSVVGAPIPLCSCGVLPTALGLRRQGATPGATVAFLVATPETGADSIALTYALTDPVMTVFRPIAGVATAIAAGLTTNFGVPSRRPVGATAALSLGAANRADARDDGHPQDQGHRHDHGHDHDPGLTSAGGESRSAAAAIDTARRISRYAFVDLLDDVSYWLMLGIVLSAVFAVAVPPALFEGDRGGGIATMLLILTLSIPLYTCASSSTPM